MLRKNYEIHHPRLPLRPYWITGISNIIYYWLEDRINIMKYKYTRKECNKEIEIIKRIFSDSQIMPGGWLETVTQYLHATQLMLLAQNEDRKDFYGESIGMKEQEKINRVRNTIRNNELNTLVGKLKCNGKKHFFDKGNICNCGGISFINPTTSPLEIEEIEELNGETFLNSEMIRKLNSLIRNQKKLYQFIKEKL
jgi:hypothetical protein